MFVVAEHGALDGLVVAGEGTEFRVVVRVGEEADVEEHVHVQRGSMFETEGEQADRETVYVRIDEASEAFSGVGRG